jgi:hypothetical protein
MALKLVTDRMTLNAAQALLDPKRINYRGSHDLSWALSLFPGSIINASQFIHNTSIQPNEYRDCVQELLSPLHEATSSCLWIVFRAAGHAIAEMRYPELATSSSGPEGALVGRLLPVLMNCIQDFHLDQFHELRNKNRDAMDLLRALALRGACHVTHDFIQYRLAYSASTDLETGIMGLRRHFILMADESRSNERTYTCFPAVLLAVRVWLVSFG